ncbi:hypothetical protein [Lysinibacillus xylanilyticus]|uniref:hypothetical protein n=1 Tax=Lysinibacillus xylanilyticus TaxID=582475 RepID=UPI003D05260D
MYLNYLKIMKSVPDIEEIRMIPFKAGLNLIIDDSINVDDHGNNVGKTTVLKIIDICFGSKNRKQIWLDSDTNSINHTLKNFIQDNKVYAELKFNASDSKSYILKVDLFERGKRLINNEPYNFNNYKEILNEIIFHTESPPTFRQLIGKFIRINQSTETGNILKYLNQNTSYATYRNIYDFLFDLSDQTESAQKLELENQINSDNKDLKDIIRLHNFSNINDLNERIRIVNNTTNNLQEQLDTMINFNLVDEQLERRDKLHTVLNQIDDFIDSLNFNKNKITQIITNETKGKPEISIEILSDLYSEVQSEFGSINKKFEELITFNNAIKENKLNYYTNRLRAVDQELTDLIENRNKLIASNQELLSIINEKNYEDFEKLHEELLSQNQLLGELNKVKQIYTSLITAINNNTALLTDISDSNSDNISKFNEYFTPMSNIALKQRLYLSPDNDFPVQISNVEDGIGTGHRKTITLLLDIAYVSFIQDVKLDFPKFFVHDVLETVDVYSFKSIVETINKNGSQFITAVLKEKIENYNFITSDDIRLRLTNDDKLFKI